MIKPFFGLLFATLLMAVSAGASAQGTCATYLCLNSAPNPVSSICRTLRQPYFLIQIWSPNFMPQPTAMQRQLWLTQGCPTADQALIAKITQTYGQLLVDPGY